MPQFTIELSAVDAASLALAASDAGQSVTAFLTKIVTDEIRATAPPSADGYLALQYLDACKATPTHVVSFAEVLNEWTKAAAGADASPMFDGLKDLDSKKFIVVNGMDISMTAKGYALIGGKP